MIRSRIVRHELQNPLQLIPHPLHFTPRLPGDPARVALTEVIKRIGFQSPVIVNSDTGYLLDGHTRRLIALELGIVQIPVCVVTVTPEEEKILLAVFDHTRDMAITDKDMLHDLCTSLIPLNLDQAIMNLLDDLLARARKLPFLPTALPEEPRTTHACPNCGHKW
jgi:hypothetical protein